MNNHDQHQQPSQHNSLTRHTSTGVNIILSRQRSNSITELRTNNSNNNTDSNNNSINDIILQRRFSTLIGTRFALILLVTFSLLLTTYYFSVTSTDSNYILLTSKNRNKQVPKQRIINNTYNSNNWLRKPAYNIDNTIAQLTKYNNNNYTNNDITSQLCRHTVSGIRYVTDSRGYVCKRNQLLNNGCCDTQYIDNDNNNQCSTCDSTLQCCESYEYCISCCIQQNDNELHKSAEYKLSDQLPADLKQDILSNPIINEYIKFDSCSHLCRTSSRSVRHGNIYKNRYKHCYNELHNDIDIRLDELTIVTAEQGISCSHACSTLQSKSHNIDNAAVGFVSGEFICWELFLDDINKCDYMNQYFKCKNGCITATQHDNTAELPAFITDINHKYNDMCLLAYNNDMYHCDAYNTYMKRLCPCVNKKYAEQYN